MRFQAFPLGRPSEIQEYQVTIEAEIAKSTWVEEILPKLSYNNVAMIEFPKLEYQSLEEPIDRINAAWKSYSSGDIEEVLTNCRKALESLGRKVKEAGYLRSEQKHDKDGKEITVTYPDWKKFFDSESKSQIIGGISRKMFDFLAPGAHAAETILEMNHGYFAILQIFSLTHFVISRFNALKDSGIGLD
jgi:hypothetical protein